MEFERKNTFHRKKTISCCQECWKQRILCNLCNGFCVFSKQFFDACKSNKSLRAQLQSKHFKQDFDSIRDSFEGTLSSDDQSDPVSCRYELLQILHKDPSKYQEILNKHDCPKFNKMPSLKNSCKEDLVFKGRCFWHRTAFSGKYFDTFGLAHKDISKQNKKAELLRAQRDIAIF